ncbi:hypothetical protein FIBSPDRAFT_860392 [Athelia psychrophila]|uniref:Uncharacterized protein n=1 Tax=Athelia psychrophila TaxID=1759441 RepID=A0A166DVC9_9AGAM|nr:hypothetical protein FIBSPDRAFT_867573 [Fibularhizoctonia sp. CBS 109695]KZP21779.1 hypothetical protein FIBSPDRAFT_860392 [Fibularhizoctonia sp. CBS 109695]
MRSHYGQNDVSEHSYDKHQCSKVENESIIRLSVVRCQPQCDERKQNGQTEDNSTRDVQHFILHSVNYPPSFLRDQLPSRVASGNKCAHITGRTTLVSTAMTNASAVNLSEMNPTFD